MSKTDVSFDVELVSPARSERASCVFPRAEWDILRDFHRDAEVLRGTRFVRNGRGGSISVTVNAEGVTSTPTLPDDEEIWAMLMKLRPFVLSNEPHNFHRTRSLLGRRLTHRAFRMQLRDIKNGFSLKTIQQKLRISMGGTHLLSDKVVMDWLNAFEYHRDPEKRESALDALGFFAQHKNGLGVVLFALTVKVKSILALGDLIETLMLVERSEMIEITCPADFLEEAGP